MRPNEIEWFCKSCSNVLGSIYQDELELNLQAVNMVKTLHGATLIRCKKCGTVKTWFTRPEVAIMGAIAAIGKMQQEDLLASIRMLMFEESRRGQARADTRENGAGDAIHQQGDDERARAGDSHVAG